VFSVDWHTGLLLHSR